ncbi:hypothetical protein PPACK8108_LOCUS23244 [Phakopsora pachyrhizi]|uniref:Uncharacterized protein n=1 Tax=Phakopsora pachyrhizi TaxID=170000 RepID=A0AAV0BM17_PHAPC|nr:hypothetical protein PPACK8108_LOCUS23244 [Phakopsora pachyrhizi]
MPRAKTNLATGNNLLFHLTNIDYAIICAWLSKPSNYSSCFGKHGSTNIGQPPASKENGFNLMVNELKKKTKLGLHLTSKQMKEAAPTPVIDEQLFRFPKMDEDIREEEDINPITNSDINTN